MLNLCRSDAGAVALGSQYLWPLQIELLWQVGSGR
jgi:hypothetical protein